MSTAALIAGPLIGAAGSMLAGSQQSSAANSAAQLQHQDQAAALAEQQREFGITQGNLAPFLKAGTSAVNTLSGLISTPGEGLLAPFTGKFQAPTAEEARATPGYEFQLGQGENAIQNSAAAQGGLLSTGALKTLNQFGQGLADTTYSQTYNRAFNEYLQGYNQFQNNQANEFNRLAAASGMGQTTATTLGQLGQQSASNIANINLTGGAQQAGSLLYGGAARASGYAGLANALGGGANNIGQLLFLQQLLQGNQLGGLNANATPSLSSIGAGIFNPGGGVTPGIVPNQGQ